MEELISKIISDNELTEEQKTVLIGKLVKASHGMDRFIDGGFYLRPDIKDSGEIEMDLWFRNIDENGETMHGPTGYDADQIITLLKQKCLNDNIQHRM